MMDEVSRLCCLEELGLGPIWRLRTPPEPEQVLPAEVVVPAISPAEPGVRFVPPGAPPRFRVGPLAGDRGEQSARDVTASAVRASAALSAAAASVPPAAAVARDLNPACTAVQAGNLDWDGLRTAVSACTACPLHARRTQAVLGIGDVQADWLFVGEGPGEEEDRRGEPFVGKAGQLLDAMLAAIQLRRGEGVYIANAVKCRPPNNRTPETAEIAACFPYLERQIDLLQPKLIVALGRPAAQALLGHEVKINAVRGKVLTYRDIPLIITYHPAYLLRNLPDKAKAWEDLCFARRVFGQL